MQSLERWQNSGQSPANKPFFPRLLKLDELPLTIYKYSKSFASSAHVNRLQDILLDWNDNEAVMNGLERRKQLDDFCKGCGWYGHHVNKNGQCSIVAQVSNSIKWLKSAKPSDLHNVVKNHKDFQRKRKSATEPPMDKKGAKVKAASALEFLTQCDLDDAFHTDSDSIHDSDTFSQHESEWHDLNFRSSSNSFAYDSEDEWLSEIFSEVHEAFESETPLYPRISRLLQYYHLDHRNHQPSFDADTFHPFLHVAEPDVDACPLDPDFHSPFSKNNSVDSSATGEIWTVP